ncbi:MAG TPA: hypothetical protein VJN88_10930 [Ktedonobacterales bacterium]|nr:hypothetical protein [Ktedonobacterales bacterium]
MSTRSEWVVGGILVALTVLSILASILRIGQGGAVNQLRGLFGLVSVVALIILAITVALIFHNVQSKLGPTNAPNLGVPAGSTIPPFYPDFATPTTPVLVR